MSCEIETKDIILRKATFEDWKSLYINASSREESAKYMLWTPAHTEEEAQMRMRKMIMYQRTHEAWIVCEKKRGQAIGWAGIEEIADSVYEDTGIVIGPEFAGKGYGKQLLLALMDYAFTKCGASKFVYSCRSKNIAAKNLQRSLGFAYTHSEERVDKRNGEGYVLEFYELKRR